MDTPITLDPLAPPSTKIVTVIGEDAQALRRRVQAALDAVVQAPNGGTAWAVVGFNPTGAGLGGKWLCELSLDRFDPLALPCGASPIFLPGARVYAVEGAADQDVATPQPAGDVSLPILRSLGNTLEAQILADLAMGRGAAQVRIKTAGANAGHRFLAMAIASLGDAPPPCPGGGGGGGPFVPFGVNSAGCDGTSSYTDGTVVLRTGGNANPAGAYNGGGLGNKAFLGCSGFANLPIASLLSIDYQWTRQLGSGGVFYNPPEPASPLVPYVNVIVDFNPPPFGPGDIRVCIMCDGQLDGPGGPISTAIGTYLNPGGLNVLQSLWTAAQDCLIVQGSPGFPPGGCPVNVTTGGTFLQNTYRWSDLIAFNPNAKLVDAFPANAIFAPTGDGGMPVGATMPAILIVSGDSPNVAKSGKRLLTLNVNGAPLLPL